MKFRGIFTIFGLLLVSGCITSNDERMVVRIVDSEGHPVNIEKSVPSFNQEQMKRQEMAERPQQSGFSPQRQQSGRGVSSVNMVPVNAENKDYAPNVPPLPDEVFADRPSAYRYSDSTRQNRMIPVQQSDTGGDTVRYVFQKPAPTIVETVDLNRAPEESGQTYTPASDEAPVIYRLGSSRPKGSGGVIEEDLSSRPASGRKVTPTPAKAGSTVPTKSIDQNSGGYYVQLGLFKTRHNADAVVERYSHIDQAFITVFENKSGSAMNRVLMGPYTRRVDAQNILNKVAAAGQRDAFITTK